MKLRVTTLMLLLALALAACAAPTAPAATVAPPTMVPPTAVPPEPTAAPTAVPPTVEPTMPPAPTDSPTATDMPTLEPVATDAPTVAPTQPPATGGDAAKGAALWPTKPCAGCHGPNAEGALGPKLAGTDDTFADVLERVRKGKEMMPPFPAAQISDAEVMDIYAWLVSLK